MLRNAGLSLFHPPRTHGLDLTPLAIPQRVEFPPVSAFIDIDSQIKSYEEVIAWLKEDAPEETDHIKRWESRLTEMKEMKKNKEIEGGKSRTGEPGTPRRKD